jgi:ABC-type multidrug transport system fused ATPase/permease subunit
LAQIDENGTETAASACTRSARGDALNHLRTLLQLAPPPRWAAPVLITLGLASSMAETLGITLVIAFLYAAMGQAGAAGTIGGRLGELLQQVQHWFGSPQLLVLAILVLILARAGLGYSNRVVSAEVGESISEAARNGLHHQYLTVSYGVIRRHEQAQLMEVLGTESWLVADAYRCWTRVLVGACSILVFGIALVMLSWHVALLALTGSVLLSLLLRRLSRPAQSLGHEVKRVHQQLSEQMLMTLEGLRTIRAYGQEAKQHNSFLHSSALARRTSLALTRLGALLDPITDVGYLVILGLIAAGAVHWGAGFATVLAAVALLYRLQPHVRDVEGNLLYLAQVEPQLRSVRAMLSCDDKRYDAPGVRPVAPLRDCIRFDNVTFRYEDRLAPALDGASFTIVAGATTALVGPSGAGKTTVINLLLRLYEPEAGTIRVDGVPLNELRRVDWLGLLAVAGQDVELVEGTVIDNIRMAKPQASQGEVIEAARLAGVAEFVEPLPEGYATWIGQQGLRFSGGQRQRVGLARAVLRDPQVLILDEATSALDSDLEQRVRAALRSRFAGRTVLVISHRPSTVSDADHVVRLDGGRVVGATPQDVTRDEPVDTVPSPTTLKDPR